MPGTVQDSVVQQPTSTQLVVSYPVPHHHREEIQIADAVCRCNITNHKAAPPFPSGYLATKDPSFLIPVSEIERHRRQNTKWTRHLRVPRRQQDNVTPPSAVTVSTTQPTSVLLKAGPPMCPPPVLQVQMMAVENGNAAQI